MRVLETKSVLSELYDVQVLQGRVFLDMSTVDDKVLGVREVADGDL